MAINTTFFVANYKLRAGTLHPTRYVATDDFTPQIQADGGTWSEVEVLGPNLGVAIVKVKAQDTTIAAIAADPDHTRFPKDNFGDALSSLSNAKLNALRNFILGLGWTQLELDNALPNGIQNVTLSQVLRFLATHKLTAGANGTGGIVMVLPKIPCESVDALDNQII
jgi:hypothetical protein